MKRSHANAQYEQRDLKKRGSLPTFTEEEKKPTHDLMKRKQGGGKAGLFAEGVSRNEGDSLRPAKRGKGDRHQMSLTRKMTEVKGGRANTISSS